MRTAVLALLCSGLAVVLVAGGTSPSEGAATGLSADVIAKLAQARVATAKYVTNLELAKADGYQIITPMIPNMGYHFLNPKIEGFDVTKPPILVYIRRSEGWQLVAIEWVWPKKPATAPLRGARYGSFGAACHYADGSFVMAAAEAQCAKSNPKTGAAFGFWHPPLVTLHLWIWYPNPEEVFGEFNPYLSPFNNDWILLLLAFLLLVASRPQRGGIPAGVAASDHEHLHAASQDFVTVRVEMTEFAFRPSTIRLPRGWPVRIVLVNKGQLAHQFESSLLRPVAVTVRNETLHVESAGVEHVRLQPGATATLQFRPLVAGRFPLACTIEGHREAGMTGVVEVR